MKSGEEENLSEVDSDDVIEDDDDSAINIKSKTNSKKRTKGRKGSQNKLKKKYVGLNFTFSVICIFLNIFNRKIDDEIDEKTKKEVNSILNSSEEDKKRLDALWEGKR